MLVSSPNDNNRVDSVRDFGDILHGVTDTQAHVRSSRRGMGLLRAYLTSGNVFGQYYLTVPFDRRIIQIPVFKETVALPYRIWISSVCIQGFLPWHPWWDDSTWRMFDHKSPQLEDDLVQSNICSAKASPPSLNQKIPVFAVSLRNSLPNSIIQVLSTSMSRR